MLNSITQAKEISLTDFRKVISETLNSDEMQIVNVKKGKKKVILDLSLFEDMYRAYQNQQWQSDLNKLQDNLAPQVINEIGRAEYDRINNLTDLDEVVAEGTKLRNKPYATLHS
jgi:UDP-galactopyranose mutase